MSKLNAKLIQHAASKNVEYRLSDGNGLFLRIRPTGAKSWLYCFRLTGSRKLQQMTIGALNDVSLKEARSMLSVLRKQVSEGIDPRQARAAIKVQNAQAITMQVLFDKWIEHIKIAAQITPKWIKQHEDRWRLHLKNTLGAILAKNIHRAHLAQALDAMVRRGTREETRKALTTLNMMLDYGLARHYIDENPARILKPKDFSATAGRPRDRVLSLQELNLLWQVLDQGTIIQNGLAVQNTMSIMSSTAIKILILTGARRGEVAGMRWDELDLNSGIWILPWERTKNRRAHTVYLSDLAISLLKKIKQISGESQFVFDTGRQSQDCHIHEDSLTSTIAKLRGTKGTKKVAPLADLKPFTVHDLRRSAATGWGEYLKTAPHVIEKMLNHQPLNKLVATYQHAVYAQEQKEAWLKWGSFIEQYVSDISHVNPLLSA
ncbi:tyrosine-type recombinase/integrase [Candidatus Berkiella cookevillensis]|nr:site-specific integrase [Candidatus Berkiella cookevillensis]MCS5708636.1 tyrosine-type recombinase/integrase [Candidatus Berkiella cookevillensis]